MNGFSLHIEPPSYILIIQPYWKALEDEELFNSLSPAGKFFMLFSSVLWSADFYKINIFEKLFQEYYPSV